MPRLASIHRPISTARQTTTEHPRNTISMHAVARCGARTRSGQPCRAPRVRGRRRCRMHGGGTDSGGQAGNRNAFRHGFYSAAERVRRAELRRFIAECEGLLRACASGEAVGFVARLRASAAGAGESGTLLPRSYGAWGRTAGKHMGALPSPSGGMRLGPRLRGDDGGGKSRNDRGGAGPPVPPNALLARRRIATGSPGDYVPGNHKNSSRD